MCVLNKNFLRLFTKKEKRKNFKVIYVIYTFHKNTAIVSTLYSVKKTIWLLGWMVGWLGAEEMWKKTI